MSNAILKSIWASEGKDTIGSDWPMKSICIQAIVVEFWPVRQSTLVVTTEWVNRILCDRLIITNPISSYRGHINQWSPKINVYSRWNTNLVIISNTAQRLADYISNQMGAIFQSGIYFVSILIYTSTQYTMHSDWLII